MLYMYMYMYTKGYKLSEGLIIYIDMIHTHTY